MEYLYNEITHPTFWLAFSKIVWIDIFLSGDNALVIAMVCRNLPQRQRLFGMIFGAASAVAMRIVLTGTAATIMEWPYIKAIGAFLLFVIAVKLLAPPKEDDSGVSEAATLLSAIGAVLLADATMSLDNIIAVAAAANGSLLLLAIGLALSIPLIVVGASFIVLVLDRLPILIWAGAGLLGWIAGETAAMDPVIQRNFGLTEFFAFGSWIPLAAPFAAVVVILSGMVWRLWQQKSIKVV